jgi:predicted acylesterase/phospholipase RssA
MRHFLRAVTFAFVAALAGCVSEQVREPVDPQQLLRLRASNAARQAAETRQALDQLLVRVKAEHDAYASGRSKTPATLDILVISGGGDWGAFGAAFIKGWRTVPRSNPLAKPRFDVITGVSTGALIAPFVFLDTDEAMESIVQLYRNPKPDFVQERGYLFFLPNNASLAEVPGLEREVRTHVTADMLKRIVEAGKGGRLLAVNTTNLDDTSSRVFNLVSEARRAVEQGDPERFHRILLASSGIPVAFPHRMIDGEMYVDGGITGNIIYGGKVSEDDSIPAQWVRRYPGVPLPKTRYWIVFNNQVHVPPEVVRQRWPTILSRSMDLSSRTSTLNAMRHLWAIAEIMQLKYKAAVEVRLVAVPDDWVVPVPGVFVKETMNTLADLGEKMGADPASWTTTPPK